MKPWWFNTVESRDLIGLSPEEQQRQIDMVKELNQWNARALRRIEELKAQSQESAAE